MEDSESISGLGINAKMNEFQAAMGLCILDEIETIIKERSIIWERYYTDLKNYLEIPN
ncbi:MAG: DegT/DnrJ/EryC1/StrS family aminotransferase [Methanolobus sp.]